MNRIQMGLARHANRLPLLLIVYFVACTGHKPGIVRLVNGKPRRTPAVSPGAYEHYLQGELALERGDPAAAVDELEQAVAIHPDSPYLHTRRAVAYQQQSKTAAAQAALTRALTLDPDFPDALLFRAAQQRGRGDSAGAIETYQHCIAKNPRYGAAYLAFASLLDQQGHPHRARKVLQQMVERVDQPALGYLQLGKLCVKVVDYACAHRAYRHAYQTRKDLFTVLRMVHVERALGNFKRATELLHEAFDRSAAAFEIAVPLASLLDQQDRQRDIDALLDVVEQQAERQPERLSAVVELELRLARPERVLALLTRNVDWPAGFVVLARAEAYHQQKRSAAALVLLEQAFNDDGDVQAALNASRILMDQQRYPGAAQLLEKALKVAPDRSNVLSALAETYGHQGDHDRAVTLLKTAHTRAPNSYAHTLALALVLQRAGRWREAVDLVQRLIATRPADGMLYNFIGYSYVEANQDLDQAETYLRKALALEPGAAHIIDSLGWLYYRQRRLELAEQLLIIATHLSPREAEVLGHLAQVKAARGNPAEAMALFKTAIAASSDPPLSERLQGQIKTLEKRQTGAPWQRATPPLEPHTP